MQQVQAYLPAKLQELVPQLQDYLINIQIKQYLTLANYLKAIGALSASLVVLKVVKILRVRRKYAHIPGPETKGLIQFFLGNFPSLSEMKKDGKIPADYFQEWHRQFGPVIKMQILDTIMVSTTEPEAIKEALVVKNFPKSPEFFESITWPLGIRFVGHGLLTDPDNKSWKEQRSVFNPGFHRNVLMNFVKEFNVKSDILMERLRTLADGKTVFKLFPELNHATLDAIAMIAFGINMDSINNEEHKKFSDHLSELLRITGDLDSNPWMKYSPAVLPIAFRLWSITRAFRAIGKKTILERMNDKSSNADQNDILAGIMKGPKGSKVDMELMLDNFLTFFLAGQETTANTLGFSFIELGRNKQIFEKCQEEVDTVLGSRTEIAYEDIGKLKYIGCVFKETLRLYPPGSVIGRRVPEDMTINGLKIPVNTTLSFPAYVTNRSEANFPNPLEFRPERFMKDTNSMDTAAPSYAYFPFSLGPRNCIGQNFAQIEGIIILAKFFQNFEMVLEPNQSFQILAEITLKPKDGTKVTLSLRK